MENNVLLQQASLEGDIPLLRDLLGKDPLLLLKPSNIHPLYIASKLGHLHFVEELLRQNPSLTEDLDSTENSTPLHGASRNGHVNVARALVSANSAMCLTHDVHERNPVHVAAMKGHVLVLEELIRVVPAAARERVGGGKGESLMQLCVKWNQFEALKLVTKVAEGGAEMLLNATDADGISFKLKGNSYTLKKEFHVWICVLALVSLVLLGHVTTLTLRFGTKLYPLVNKIRRAR